ncbi:hypothetical protein CHGG_04863 [Chaetomium globosum CBS 148.51]|uniref:Bul1 C-terminal domain-containing protein n=1 Tax=Chaetomium globosum (strain ATCC 6205 / CBS 148.51 / DSM 1962 / NBRC 6347 / NRRL 1970) TaxID=306901 RepID=Q2H033_CHAGB|nr:uncharacterized protein CHGG_04863 [Chaetomium globosum CBS 148.51]EAQ88244.1 hypothetical protein CHGG_04863 [Chaetomium globosum CBS 148.51]
MGTWLASSAASIVSPSNGPSHAKRMAYPKSDISVNLKDHYSSKVYTSLSPVAGDLTITTKRDVRFDSIQILLLGHTKTLFEGMSAPQEVTHTFLKMVMPIPESTYPVPRVLQTGETYTIPFNFVIPNQLTINACNHARLSDAMQDHHVRLPPSLGGWERDDMAPLMAQVEYKITARVLRDDGDHRTRIMEASQPLRVLPASPEDPPLNITDKDRLYRMSKTKTLRKNILTTKLGRLTAEALQPGAAVLSSDGRRVMSHPMARIRLSFDPASPRTLPPTITGVTAKVTAHTYYSSGTISSFPNLGEWNAPYLTDRRGQFFTSTSLPPVTLAEQPAWTSPSSKPSSPLARRDSGYGSSMHSARSSSSDLDTNTNNTHNPLLPPNHKQQQQQQTTTIRVPLSLPTDKRTFVPTFHSCIASRVYTVQLTVALASKGASNTVTLTVPLQVAVDASTSGSASGSVSSRASSESGENETEEVVVGSGGPPSFEEAEADEHLRPRVLLVPSEEELGGGGGGGRERGSWMLAAGGEGQAADRGGLPEYGEAGWRRRVD